MKNLFFKRLIIYTMIGISFIIGYHVYSIDLSNMSILETGSSVTGSMDYVPGEVLVKYKMPSKAGDDWIDISDLSSKKSLSTNLSKQNLSIKDTIPQGNIGVISIQDSKTVEETIELLENDKNVEYAEPNYIFHVATINTNDTSGSLLWGLDNYGQIVNNGVSGLSGEDIDWVKAWQTFSGSFTDSQTGILVGIIDEGVNYNHEDLIDSIWVNKGYNFVNNNNDPMPVGFKYNYHGTHIAGTIAATINNSKGIVGVNPNAKIMSLNVGDGTNLFMGSSLIGAINYATDNGVKIINASWGSAGAPSSGIYEAIERFRNAGGLFITAAMNDSNDNDIRQYYPCNYDLDNIICVAATNQNGLFAGFSNYGSETVDVGAPGVDIYSTIFDATYNNYFLNDFFAFDFISFLEFSNGWEKSGEVYYDGFGIQLKKGDTNDITYVQSPLIDTTVANNSDICIEVDAVCQSGWMELFVNTGLERHYLSSYMPQTSNKNCYNIGKTSNLSYKLSLSDSLTSTGGSCDIFLVGLKSYKKYEGSNNLYGYWAGTSMATPHVVGLASLAWSFRPDLSYLEIKDAIMDNGDSLTSLSGKTVSGKRINVYKTLFALDNYTPEKPSLVSPSSGYQYTGFDTPLELSFEWNASHDTGVGVSGYIFELSNDYEFNQLVTGITLDNTGLNFDITNTGVYYWRVKAFDKKGNTGEYSEIYPILLGELPCQFNGNTINHGESVTGYKSNTVPYGSGCESEIRTCTNGTLSGTFQYSGCSAESPASCQFNGNTINHGESVTGYESGTVSYGGICRSEIRTCTNGILSGTFQYSGCVVQSNGGGGGARLRKDKCPGGDFSDSYYDGSCEKSTKNEHNLVNTNTGSPYQRGEKLKYDTSKYNPKYSNEMNQAYQYAYYYGITTREGIGKANMTGGLTRAAMAKMLSQYAINVLGMEPDKTVWNKFTDVSTQLDEAYDNGVTLAYQLGIMGINMKNNKFRPYDTVSRVEFATALSRLLYGIEDGKDKYYSTHMNLLKYLGILTNTDPKMEEQRGYVMLMLMRSDKNN